jgi:hypothetical protein
MCLWRAARQQESVKLRGCTDFHSLSDRTDEPFVPISQRFMLSPRFMLCTQAATGQQSYVHASCFNTGIATQSRIS